MRRAAILLAALLLTACSGADSAPGDPDAVLVADDRPDLVDVTAPVACNGSPALCDRRYDQVVYPTTHNSMSSDEAGWVPPNQNWGVPRQLADGVRGLMLDFWHWTGGDEEHPEGTYLCHSVCGLGSQPLVDGLKEIREFLDANPREVVTIIAESYIPADEAAVAFEAAGLIPKLHVQDRAAPWPTLREMIDAGHTLVVLTDSGGGDPKYPWYLDEWTFVGETPWLNEVLTDFTCRLDRGSWDNPLFVLDEMLLHPFSTPEKAAEANALDFFLPRARQCQAEAGHLPNFPTVDFYDVGDVFTVCAALNGLNGL